MSILNVIEVIVLLPLAVHQATNILRYSSLFAFLRDRLEIGQGIPFIPDRFNAKISELIQCPWCLSVHISWILSIPFIANLALSAVASRLSAFSFWQLILVANIGRFVVMALAVSQIANLIHFYTKHRGPK